MTERERLIELLNKSCEERGWLMNGTGTIADFLLENGVVVLPCKVGDTVWCIDTVWNEICKGKVIYVKQNYYTQDVCLHWLGIEYNHSKIGIQVECSRADLMLGKTVFLTKEEAEKALKESEENE